MNEREKLIDLIIESVDGCARNWAEIIAEHLIDNGVRIPPCKVGDIVYQCDDGRVYESEIIGVIYDTDGIAFDESAIGKSIFLSKEEAESALERKIAAYEKKKPLMF